MRQYFHPALFIGTAVILLLATMVGITVWQQRHQFSSPAQSSDWYKGTIAHEAEQKVEQELFLKNDFIAPWAAFRFAAFNTGSKGVVIGEDGYFFTAEEFSTSGNLESQLEARFLFMQKAISTLNSHGINVHIVLIPAKTRIAADKLGKHRVPVARQALYSRIKQEFTAQKYWHTDTLPLFEEWYDAGNTPFIPNDTHWSPLMAEYVANRLVDKVYENCRVTSMLTRGYETREQPAQFHEGDLVDFIGITAEPWKRMYGPSDSMIHPLETIATEHQPFGLFDDVPIGVALVGTSYSANEKWNFTGSLKTALQTDIVNWAEEGGGPFAPMATFLHKTDFKTSPLRLVIWEIPERYFWTDDAPDEVLFDDISGKSAKRSFICSKGRS